MIKDEELDHGFESDGNQDEKSEKSKSSKFKPNHDKSQQSKSSNNNESLNASDITPESSDESQSEGEEKSEIDKYTSTTGQPPFHRKNAPSDAPLMSKPCKHSILLIYAIFSICQTCYNYAWDDHEWSKWTPCS